MIVVGLQLSGCMTLLGDPYADLGAWQDARNRKLDAQYPPGLPDRQATAYEARAV